MYKWICAVQIHIVIDIFYSVFFFLMLVKTDWIKVMMYK